MKIRSSAGATENGIVVGNTFDKYGSSNPVVKWIMKGFETTLDSMVKQAQPTTINEIGCGEGYWVLRWNEKGLLARGCDFSKQVIEIARENAALQGLSPSLFESRSIYDLDAKQDSADLVVCSEVLEHLDNPKAGLQALQRVVRRHLIVSVPQEPLWCALNLARGKYISHWGNTPGHIQHWSKNGFVNLVSKYFALVEVRAPIAVDYASLPSPWLSMSPALQRTLHWVGSGLALTGIAFVALRLHEYWGSLDVSQITAVAWVAIAGLAMLYGVANLLLALAWLKLLAQFGVQVTRLWSIRVYGVSQLAKYVPGNIFHLAGRQAIGMAGASSGVLAKSTLWELGLIALSGMLYGWLVLPLLAPGFPSLASIIALLGTVSVVAYLLRRFVGSHVSVSFGCQMLFLAVSGGVFVTLLNVIVSGSELHPQTWLLIGGAYVVAWLAGLVTPGAPAGVGVRELILLLLLKGLVTDADLLMAVLLGRLVTVVGDLLFFITSFLIPAKLCLLDKNYG